MQMDIFKSTLFLSQFGYNYLIFLSEGSFFYPRNGEKHTNMNFPQHKMEEIYVYKIGNNLTWGIFQPKKNPSSPTEYQMAVPLNELIKKAI